MPRGVRRANVYPVGWRSMELDERRKAHQQGTCSGSGDHQTYSCTEYTPQHAASQSPILLRCNEDLIIAVPS